MKLSISKCNPIFAFMLLIALGFSSCGLYKSDSKEKTSNAFYNTTWKLTELNGSPVADKVNGKEPFILFDKSENRFSASGGCNVMSGEFTLKANKIKFSRAIATMMACEDMSIERGIGQMLEKADNFDIKDGTLYLKNGKTTVAKMIVSKGEDKKIALDGTWELNYILNPEEDFQSLYKEQKPLITFATAEHKVSGNSSCNNFFGGYNTTEENHIKFASLGMTRKFCPGNGESVFMKNLEKVTRYAITEDTLTFISDDITIMRFHKK